MIILPSDLQAKARMVKQYEMYSDELKVDAPDSIKKLNEEVLQWKNAHKRLVRPEMPRNIQAKEELVNQYRECLGLREDAPDHIREFQAEIQAFYDKHDGNVL
ncbi:MULTISPECIES: hypothetical protein [unclassified Butyrivibrio]|uniref:hypothetical protein n=1 Tax=unclassified Butyrivibrio TaxID=2639466 RepID=UPI0003B495C4|nr:MULTISPECIES: hypothetical protein [unclassified Butyrivibrio]